VELICWGNRYHICLPPTNNIPLHTELPPVISAVDEIDALSVLRFARWSSFVGSCPCGRLLPFKSTVLVLDAQYGGTHRTHSNPGAYLFVSCIQYLGSLRCGAVEHEDIVRLLASLHRVLQSVIGAFQVLNVLPVHLWEVSVK
jgi:hypothetical protein